MKTPYVMLRNKRVIKMRNIRNIFLSLLVAQIIPCVAIAGGGVQINNLKGSWKNPIMSYCQGSNLGNATIGRYKDTCKG